MMTLSLLVKRTALLMATALFVTVGLSSCAATGGKLVHSNETAALFSSGRVLPEYRYYYSGSHDEPFAILGVHRDYALRTELWNEINLTEDQLGRWIDTLESKWMANFRHSYYGADVVDETGAKVGIWYGQVDWTTVKRGSGNDVYIYTPDRLLRNNFGFNTGYYDGH